VSYADGVLSKDIPTELARLRRVEDMCDPVSTWIIESIIESTGPQADWRFLDIGAGAGSIARWLTGKGQVVATDLDTRFLEPGVHEPLPGEVAKRLTVLRHDVTADPDPGGPFDLIHIRFVLEHLPSRTETLRRVLQWLAPGGWIVVVGIDILPSASSPHPPIRETARAMLDLMTEQMGTEVSFTRRLPIVLAEQGMTGIRTAFEPIVAGDGGAGERFFQAIFSQLSKPLIASGRLTEEQVSGMNEWFGQPGNVDLAGLIPAVWAQRPR
jgi:SAM-dependent methyltransferase